MHVQSFLGPASITSDLPSEHPYCYLRWWCPHSAGENLDLQSNGLGSQQKTWLLEGLLDLWVKVLGGKQPTIWDAPMAAANFSIACWPEFLKNRTLTSGQFAWQQCQQLLEKLLPGPLQTYSVDTIVGIWFFLEVSLCHLKWVSAVRNLRKSSFICRTQDIWKFAFKLLWVTGGVAQAIRVPALQMGNLEFKTLVPPKEPKKW
jgi:hypothetical protein